LAKPVNFPEVDKIEDYPPPNPSSPLPVKRLPTRNVSCWEFEEGELAEFLESGQLWISNQTFEKLDPDPSGDRHQPSLIVTTNKACALTGQRPAVARDAPASNRIVRYDDNSAAFEEVRDGFHDLAKSLSEGNDVGQMTDPEVQRARQEVMMLQHAFACDVISADWLIEPTRKTLLWIANAAGEAVVGGIALGLLAIVLKHFAS
jgi:hypothetical protein